MEFICDNCKKVYNKPPSRRLQNKNFCNMQCNLQFRRKQKLSTQKIKNYTHYIEVSIFLRNKEIIIKLSNEDAYIAKNYILGANFDKTINGYYVYIRHSDKNRERLHRHITKCPPDMQVDHINRDTLDNRRENLRIVTNKVNVINQGLSKKNKSGYKGVCYIKKDNKWRANIERKYLGQFNTKEEAIQARLQAEEKLWKNIKESKTNDN